MSRHPSLWFVVPAHGRFNLTAICLRQLRRTCDALTDEGIEASAVIIACDENLDTARALGFGTVERDNRFLSRRFNDGIQLACDPAFNPRPVDYVVPCGSDDWVDYRLFLDLPPPDVVVGFQRLSFVREDGSELMTRELDVLGGCGIRIYPRRVVAKLRYRPADEDRPRACDTSILVNTRRAYPDVQVVHRESDPRQIVDWKSETQQLNPFDSIAHLHRRGDSTADLFTALADIFPADALDEMAAHYGALVPA
jgi:hypothetical protein